MVLRQHRQQGVLLQEHRFQLRIGGQIQDAEVHPPGEDPVLDLPLLPHQQLEINIGMGAKESLRPAGQQPCRRAAERPHPDQPGPEAPELDHL